MNIFGEPAKKGTFKVDPKDLSKSKTSKAGRATRRKEDELERQKEFTFLQIIHDKYDTYQKTLFLQNKVFML